MTTLRVLVPAIPVPTVLLGLVVTLLDGSAPGLAIRLAGLLAVIACLVLALVGTAPINAAALRLSAH